VLSDDWAKETFIQAGKLNADMVLLGASERGLSHRFFLGNRIERILSSTPCDVGIYRKL
jgi:nucleotide-binding universal stress UspA family protein